MSTRRSRRQLLAAAAAGVAGVAGGTLPRLAAAQSYPERPIRMIVPFPAGGPTDTVARALGQLMAEAMGQPIIVDNRAGANGNIALEAAARAEPDGYTLFMTATSISSINPSLLKSMPVDPRTLAPVGFVVAIPNVLTINPKVPATTVKELVAHFRNNRNANFGANGAGTTTRVGWVLFEKQGGFNVTHVMYRGDAPMMVDLLSNVVQASMPTVFGGAPHVRSGALRGLAVTSLERSPALPDVPTMAEAGFPDFEAITWFGVVAPQGTPGAVVQRLNREINAALGKPAMQQRLRDLGATPRTMGVEEFRAFLAADRSKWTEVVTSAGITAD